MDELEQITTRYLLGELSESEQMALEERFFTDPQVFNQVLQAESKLVDAYARGRLSNEMRERFEQSYLQHPARRDRVEFARALTTSLHVAEIAVVATRPEADDEVFGRAGDAADHAGGRLDFR
jgi:anti-sigma factor RsiW